MKPPLLVTHEALEQARKAFWVEDIDIHVIRREVRSAILEGRARRSGKRMVTVWTPNGSHVYHVTWSRRSGQITVRHAHRNRDVQVDGVAA